MAARSIATLSLTFGLVSIPVKLYSATESSSAIRFKLMSAGGARLRQQYVSDEPERDAPPPELDAEDETEEDEGAHAEATPARAAPVSATRAEGSRVLDFPKARPGSVAAPPATRSAPVPASVPEPSAAPAPVVIERSGMAKGYEFEKGKFVLFTADELKALQEASRQTIDIVAFIPDRSVDPIYFDKAYFLAPDKRGAKPYSLLLRAMQDTGRCALAKWAFRSKEVVVQIRAGDGGLVLQQLLYAEEVRSLADLDIGLADVSETELALARQLIEQISLDAYDPTQFVDEEKQRILAAVEEKIRGRQVVAPAHREAPAGADVVDLVAALRASLQTAPPRPSSSAKGREAPRAAPATERKPVRRAQGRTSGQAAPAKGRSGKA